MTTGREDDALSWDGDDDPTLVAPRRAPREPDAPPRADDADGQEAGVAPVALPDGYAAVGRGSADVGRVEADGSVVMPGDRAPMSSALLVTLGIIAGVFLLFTIGWIVGGLRLQGTADFLVSPVGYRFAFWLAVAAPAVWFVTAFLLTRAARTWVRVVWLLAGLVLLVPWPFIMVGAVGQ